MTTVPFTGIGDPIEAFNIDNVLVNKEILPGETRLRTSFPYPTLEMWRRTALQSTATSPTTGSSDIATRGRTTVIFAHGADMGSVFTYLAGTTPEMVAGYYVDQVRAITADASMQTALTQTAQALVELAQLHVPEQYIAFIKDRCGGVSFNHRVAGLCAAVYLTSILLSEAGL